jgi:hypothetical protein
MRIQVTLEFSVSDGASLDQIERVVDRHVTLIDGKKAYSWMILDEHRQPLPLSQWPRRANGRGVRREYDLAPDPAQESDSA